MKSLLLKNLFTAIVFIPAFAFAQDIAHNHIDLPKTEIATLNPTQETKQNIFLHVDYDQKNHLLTIATKDELVNASITVLTGKDRVIYKEDGLKIENHYLLSIDEDSPKGVYYIYVEEADRGIWIEKFVK